RGQAVRSGERLIGEASRARPEAPRDDDLVVLRAGAVVADLVLALARLLEHLSAKQHAVPLDEDLLLRVVAGALEGSRQAHEALDGDLFFRIRAALVLDLEAPRRGAGRGDLRGVERRADGDEHVLADHERARGRRRGGLGLRLFLVPLAALVFVLACLV